MDLHKGLVLASGYLVYGMSIGFFYALGALFNVIMDTFNASRAETSVIQSIYAACLLGGGIVYGGIASRFGPTKTTVFGSLATSLGLIASFWATSLPFLMATSAVTACGCGLCFVTCTVGVRQQFRGKSGVMAMALVSSSSGTLGVVFTYLLRYISNVYGLRGTLLIMGGLQLNGAVLCLLWKTKTYSNKLQNETDSDQSKANITNNHTTINEPSSPEFTSNSSTVTSPSHLSPTPDNTNTCVVLRSVGHTNEGYVTSTDMVEDCSGEPKLVHPSTVHSKDGHAHGKQTTYSQPLPKKPLQDTIDSEGMEAHVAEMSVIAKLKHILGIPSYTFTLVGMLMCMNCLQMYVVFIVDMFIDRGLSEVQGSTALAVINIAAIFGRISPAISVRFPFYSPFLMPILTGVMSTIAMAILTVAANVYLLFCLAGVIGYSVGVAVSVIVVNISELVGLAFLAEAVGLLMSPIGLFILFVGPLTGYLRDSSGSYDHSHIISATFTGLGTVMLIAAYFFHKQQRKPSEPKQASVFYMTRL